MLNYNYKKLNQNKINHVIKTINNFQKIKIFEFYLIFANIFEKIKIDQLFKFNFYNYIINVDNVVSLFDFIYNLSIIEFKTLRFYLNKYSIKNLLFYRNSL